MSETYGRQEGSAYNGYFTCNCYHPLFCFNHLGDLERVLLRNGNVASADNWRSVLEPVVARYRDLDISKCLRGDAAFAIPELYSFLEGEAYGYAIRLKSNAVLERKIQHLLRRPVGRLPKKPVVRYHQFMYQAGSWERECRVVAKVEWHQGSGAPGFPCIGFIVTNLSWQCKRIVRFYNQRGTPEQWIREGKNAVKWTKLSCHDFMDNLVPDVHRDSLWRCQSGQPGPRVCHQGFRVAILGQTTAFHADLRPEASSLGLDWPRALHGLLKGPAATRAEVKWEMSDR